MNERDKWYWKVKDRLDEVGYYRLDDKIVEILKKKNEILTKVIKEFADEHSS